MMMPSRAPEARVKSKVALVRCLDYGHQTLTKAVRDSFSLIGGLGSIIKKGDSVLIKPNLLAAKRPDQAITTHPEVVAAVVEEVKRVGGRFCPIPSSFKMEEYYLPSVERIIDAVREILEF